MTRKPAHTFQYIENTGLSKAEVLRRARELKAKLEDRFGSDRCCTVQTCIDAVIDAASEHAQGEIA